MAAFKGIVIVMPGPESNAFGVFDAQAGRFRPKMDGANTSSGV